MHSMNAYNTNEYEDSIYSNIPTYMEMGVMLLSHHLDLPSVKSI